MKNKIKKRRLILKKWVRVTIISILLLLLCISLYLVITGLFPNINKVPYYNYNVKRNIDYKVYLKENNFFKDNYVEKDKQYTSDLIDYINVDLSYLFNGSAITNMNYDYDITATIIGEYENSNNGKEELLKKEYKLLETQNKSLYDTQEFDINQNLKIKYDDYRKVVDDFNNQFDLSMDAYLNIKLNIKYNGLILKNKYEVNGKDKLELNIPLTKQIIKIETKYDKETNKNLTPTINEQKNMNKIYTGIIISIIAISLMLVLHDKIFISKKTYYTKMLNKILKNYSQIIVEISNPINYDELEILDIKNFDDMIDANQELKTPILLYEVEEGKESHFVVVNDKYAYRFILNNNSYSK